MRLLLASLMSIALVSVLVGAGTSAYLADSETSDVNTFETGVLNLYLTDYGDVNHVWTMDNMIPGESITLGQLSIRNIGHMGADHAELSFSSVCTEPGMDAYLKVSSMWYSDGSHPPMQIVDFNGQALPIVMYGTDVIIDGVNSAIAIPDYNGNGYIDLQDLNHVSLDNLVAPKANSDPLSTDHCDLNMLINFEFDASNNYQGDECIFTVEFTLNQDQSQLRGSMFFSYLFFFWD